MRRILYIVFYAALVLFIIVPQSQAAYTKKYDMYFYKYSKLYFGLGFDWKWFKAQSIAESALNPKAVSPVGATGLMQIMKNTRKELEEKLNWVVSPTDPEWNIAAGIFYDRYLYNNWKAKRSSIDRLSLMFASYNGGLGNLLKSQRLCIKNENINCNTWDNIVKYAHLVDTWISDESLTYVKRIKYFKNLL